MTGSEANASDSVAASTANPQAKTVDEAIAAYAEEWIIIQIMQDGDDD